MKDKSTDDGRLNGPIVRLARRTFFKGIVNVYQDDVLIHKSIKAKQILIEYPASVMVVPFIDRASVLMLRQYRYGLAAWNYEFPGGIVDADEDPRVAAARELVEETGFTTDNLQHMLDVHPDPALTTQVVHIFIARALLNGDASLEESELIRTKRLSLAELSSLISEGQITDAATLIGSMVAINNVSKLQ